MPPHFEQTVTSTAKRSSLGRPGAKSWESWVGAGGCGEVPDDPRAEAVVAGEHPVVAGLRQDVVDEE
ncbi:MAG: hypothetical protein KC486_16965, partial [Myxococcales bacterium]|nr:hypothetical protein [Myxococcales bacterium]